MSDDNYRVESTASGVEITLGPMSAFEVGPDTAVKLAALLCKKAGCNVKFHPDGMVVKFPSKSEKMN